MRDDAHGVRRWARAQAPHGVREGGGPRLSRQRVMTAGVTVWALHYCNTLWPASLITTCQRHWRNLHTPGVPDDRCRAHAILGHEHLP